MENRWNLTASGPRPNPQGSYHYGLIKPGRTIMLANSAPIINRKQRYAVNSVSFIPADTPLKLADYFNIPGVFNLGSIPTSPTWGNAYLQTSVMAANFREFVEIVFQNWEDTVQSWHIDGYSFFVVGLVDLSTKMLYSTEPSTEPGNFPFPTFSSLQILFLKSEELSTSDWT